MAADSPTVPNAFPSFDAKPLTRMNATNSFTLRPRLRWPAWPTLLSAALLVHFMISSAVWLLWFVGILRNPDMRDHFIPSLQPSAPAFVFCGLSAVSLSLALRGHRAARRAALFVLAATVTLFIIDAHFEHWQLHTFIASKEYWAAGGKKHDYFTWWWFNDRWLE